MGLSGLRNTLGREHSIGAMGRGMVVCSVASAYCLRTHKGATHSTLAKASTPTGRWGGFMMWDTVNVQWIAPASAQGTRT